MAFCEEFDGFLTDFVYGIWNLLVFFCFVMGISFDFVLYGI